MVIFPILNFNLIHQAGNALKNKARYVMGRRHNSVATAFCWV